MAGGVSLRRTADALTERTLVSRRVYEGRVVSLRVDEVELASGRIARREVVEHRGAVCILAFDDEGQVLLVRQHRYPIGEALLELPAGTLESGETPDACVARELAEETGYTPGRIEPLLEFYSAPGFCTELLHVYVATALREERLAGDEDESIDLERMPLTEALAMAAQGGFRDAKTLVALLAYGARDSTGAGRT